MRDPWGFGVDVPANGQAIQFRRQRYRNGMLLGWEDGIGVVSYVWCGVEPVVTLVDDTYVHVSLDDRWWPLVDVA